MVDSITTTSSDPTCFELSDALAVLVDGSFQDRWEVAKVISQWGTAAIEPLVDLLQEQDPELSWFIARILGQVHHPAAVKVLIGLLQSDDPEVSSIAAEALGAMGDMAIASLVPQLHQSETRALAVRSLALIPHSAVVDPLLNVVTDTDSDIRATAIAALSNHTDPRILPALAAALSDHAAKVRCEAVLGLGLVASRLHQDDFNHVVYTLDELATMLHPHLWDINLEVCTQTVLALGRVGTDRACASIYQLLTAATTPPDLQRYSLLALSWIPTPTALNYLHQALRNYIGNTPSLAQAVIISLGQIEHPQLLSSAANLLLTLLEPPIADSLDPCCRQALALSLGYLEAREHHPLIIPALQQLREDDDAGVRLHAIAALKAITDHSQSFTAPRKHFKSS